MVCLWYFQVCYDRCLWNLEFSKFVVCSHVPHEHLGICSCSATEQKTSVTWHCKARKLWRVSFEPMPFRWKERLFKFWFTKLASKFAFRLLLLAFLLVLLKEYLNWANLVSDPIVVVKFQILTSIISSSTNYLFKFQAARRLLKFLFVDTLLQLGNVAFTLCPHFRLKFLEFLLA